MLAKVNFRNGGSYFTAIDDLHTPETLAQRMVGGGFVICEDSRWGKHRVIVVNLSDVQSIVLEPSNNASTRPPLAEGTQGEGNHSGGG